MSETSETPKPPEIKFAIVIGLQGPINPGEYTVGSAKIVVSCPDEVQIGLPTPIKLPKGVSTLFVVSWFDPKGRTKKLFESSRSNVTCRSIWL